MFSQLSAWSFPPDEEDFHEFLQKFLLLQVQSQKNSLKNRYLLKKGSSKTHSYFSLVLRSISLAWKRLPRDELTLKFFQSIQKSTGIFQCTILLLLSHNPRSDSFAPLNFHKKMPREYKHSWSSINSTWWFELCLILIFELQMNNSHNENGKGVWTLKMGTILAFCLGFLTSQAIL